MAVGGSESRIFWIWAITSLNIFYSSIWGPVAGVILPLEIKLLVSSDAAAILGHIVSCLTVTDALGLVIAYFSDRCTSRWGRRRPFIVSGSLLVVVGIALFTLTHYLHSVAVLPLSLVIYVGLAFVYASVNALMPDVVVASRLSIASGTFNVNGVLGSFIGYGILSFDLPFIVPMLVMAIATAVFTVLCCVFAKEKPLSAGGKGAVAAGDVVDVIVDVAQKEMRMKMEEEKEKLKKKKKKKKRAAKVYDVETDAGVFSVSISPAPSLTPSASFSVEQTTDDVPQVDMQKKNAVKRCFCGVHDALASFYFDPRKHPDFILCCMMRFCNSTTVGAVGFIQYWLADCVPLTLDEAQRVTSILSILMLVGGALASVVAKFSNRLGLKNILVFTTIFQSFLLVIPAFIYNASLLYAIAILIGVTSALYSIAEIPMAFLTLPSSRMTGKSMSIFTIFQFSSFSFSFSFSLFSHYFDSRTAGIVFGQELFGNLLQRYSIPGTNSFEIDGYVVSCCCCFAFFSFFFSPSLIRFLSFSS